MALYSEKVMDHFRNPRNLGVLEDANAIGEVGNAKCGDIMKMYLKIEDDVVQDVKFETFGCGSAIASSSMATELIKGKPLSEVKELTNQAVAEALDGLPAHKLHCSVLAEEAIKAALEDYESRREAAQPEAAPEISIQYRPEEKRVVALDGEKPVGECTYRETEGFWVVEHTRVQPDYGGRGIARQLVDEVLAQAKAQRKKIEAQCTYAYKVLQEEDPQILVGTEPNACRI